MIQYECLTAIGIHCQCQTARKSPAEFICLASPFVVLVPFLHYHSINAKSTSLLIWYECPTAIGIHCQCQTASKSAAESICFAIHFAALAFLSSHRAGAALRSCLLSISYSPLHNMRRKIECNIKALYRKTCTNMKT